MGGGDLPKQLAIFLASFPSDFDLEELAGKVANHNHMTVGRGNLCNGKPVAKCTDLNHMTTGCWNHGNFEHLSLLLLLQHGQNFKWW